LDYKEKLTAEIEGKEWISQPRQPRPSRSSTPQISSSGMSRNSSSSSFQQPISAAQKARNESYFAGLGTTNSQRPDGLPPSQGGKYTGFGSTPPPPPPAEGISVEEFTTDPLGTLTKSWSLFSRAAVKTATMVNETYVQPSVAKVVLLC
jgi:ADP-ribosylation factor GTPase-activating protein 1